jgi:hypothetical protein
MALATSEICGLEAMRTGLDEGLAISEICGLEASSPSIIVLPCPLTATHAPGTSREVDYFAARRCPYGLFTSRAPLPRRGPHDEDAALPSVISLTDPASCELPKAEASKPRRRSRRPHTTHEAANSQHHRNAAHGAQILGLEHLTELLSILNNPWLDLGSLQESRVARVIALTMANPESKRVMLLVAWAKSATVEKCKRQ